MGASEENIKRFLEKRGYKAEVEQVRPGNFKVSLYSKSVDGVAGLLASISEGSRFVVAVHHPDLLELVEDGLQLEMFKGYITQNMNNGLESLRTENRVMNESLGKIIDDFIERVMAIEKRPWWKFWSTK